MLENMYDVLRRPQKAFARIATEEKLMPAVGIQMCILILNFLVDKNGTGSSWGNVAIGIVVGIPMMAFFWWLTAFVTNWLSHRFGGTGTWKKQLIAIGYTMLPDIVFIPIEVAMLWLGMTEAFIAIVACISSIWSLILCVYAIKVVQNISIAKSVLVIVLPTIAVLIVGTIICFALVLNGY